MPNNITTNYGKVVVDTSFIPYIRENDVEFVARNLKPYKLSKIFFDDIAVNQFCQVGNKVVLDSKKKVTVNSGAVVYVNDIAYQGSSNTVNTFNAIIDAWDSGTATVTLRALSGNFDSEAQLYLENVSSGLITANCNVVSVTNFNTSDIFSAGEGVINPSGANVFAKVIATSGENVLYLNQNFVSLSVNANGAASISSMGNEYKVGDIVYQTATGEPRYDLAIFTGIVEHYDISVPATLAVTPLKGSITANSTGTSGNAIVRIWNASNTASLALTANAFNTNGFTATQNVQSTSNSAKTIKVTSYTHKSGILGNTLNPNLSSVILSTSDAANHAHANGNLIYFATGTGVGTLKRIEAISGSVAVLNSALTVDYTSNTHYSLGNFYVDEYGTQAGIFHIPSYPGFKFKSGNRILTITDTSTYNNPDYTMRAAATYAASGLLKTEQRIQTTPILAPLPEVNADNLVAPATPAERVYNATNNKSPVTGSTGSSIPRVPLGDGLSQTFFTPKPLSNKQDYGIFVTSVDLFFKNKPSIANGSMQLPVTVKIAEVLNGYPTKNYVASKTIQAKDIKTSDLPSTADASTKTKFTFDDPVYLEPNREYALVVGSDSPEYELFIAELGEDVLGSNPVRRISEQPYAGSLFRSQNSSTWTAYQNQDLMFVINKAVFESSGTATFNLEETPTANVDVDRVMVLASDLKFPKALVDYRLQGIYSYTKDYETNGIYTIPYFNLEYGVIQDRSGKETSGNFLNRRKVIRGNANSYLMTVEMSSTDADISPIVNLERLALNSITYNINNAGLTNSYISITNAGAGYNALSSSGNVVKGSSNNTINNFAQLYRETYLANNYNVGFYTVTFAGTYGSGASGFAVANTDGTNTVNYIVMTGFGSGYIETPTIVFTSGNATSNTTATGLVAGETGKSGGNIRTKYISREIVLEDGFEAGDLRVFMDAIRPSPTDIQVYYKVHSADDPERFSDKSWRRMEKVKDIYSNNPRTMIALEFRPSLEENRIVYEENGRVYPIGGKFKSFAFKICMTSPDPSLIPKIKNVRMIATPEG